MGKTYQILATIIIIIVFSLYVSKQYFPISFKNIFNINTKIEIPAQVINIDTVKNIVQGRSGNRIESTYLIYYSYAFKSKRYTGKERIKDILRLKVNDIKVKVDTNSPRISYISY